MKKLTVDEHEIAQYRLEDQRGEPVTPATRRVDGNRHVTEVEAKLGSSRGYAGHYERTDEPCPNCLELGRRTNGGDYITLRRRIDGLDYVLRCVHCNFVPRQER